MLMQRADSLFSTKCIKACSYVFFNSKAKAEACNLDDKNDYQSAYCQIEIC